MRPFTRYDLGAQGKRHVLERLEDGRTLSRLLRREWSLEEGSVHTHLPAGLDPAALEAFERGGKLFPAPASARLGRAPDGSLHRMTPIPNTDRGLAELIQAHLRRGEGRICLFENALAHAADPWLARARSHLRFREEEVYHLLCWSEARRDVIESTIREAKSIPVFIGVLSRGEGICEQEGRDVPRDRLQGIARASEAIIVGAYDGEGYLIWTRT